MRFHIRGSEGLFASHYCPAETDEAVGWVVLTGAGGALCTVATLGAMTAPPTGTRDSVGPSLDAASTASG